MQQSGVQRADERPKDLDRTFCDRGLNENDGVLQQCKTQTGHECDRQQRLPLRRDEHGKQQHRQRLDDLLGHRRDVGRHVVQILTDRDAELTVELGNEQTAAHADKREQQNEPRLLAVDPDAEHERERKTDKYDIGYVPFAIEGNRTLP